VAVGFRIYRLPAWNLLFSAEAIADVTVVVWHYFFPGLPEDGLEFT